MINCRTHRVGVIAKAANTFAFLAAGQNMRSKHRLSITNNDRNAVFLKKEDFRPLKVDGAQEIGAAHFCTIMWGDSGHHWLVPDLQDVNANPG